jgi:hypothetical protein
MSFFFFLHKRSTEEKKGIKVVSEGGHCVVPFRRCHSGGAIVFFFFCLLCHFVFSLWKVESVACACGIPLAKLSLNILETMLAMPRNIALWLRNFTCAPEASSRLC